MSEDFKLLTDGEHIRHRFGMYGGSKTVQQENVFVNAEFKQMPLVGGLLKVINEIIDNSIDEHIRTNKKFANEITVNIKNGVVEVKDNGRGIPSVKVDTPDGKKYQLVAAFTHARAGSNFDDSKRESIGTNGVGSMITFVTSKKFEAKADDGNLEVHLLTKDAKVTSVKTKPSSWRGTYVKFTPDYEFFGLETMTQDHIDAIENRVKSLALAFPTIRFKFNNRVVKVKFEDYFGPTIQFKNEKSYFGITKSSGTFESFTLVNGLSVLGGQHVETFLDYFIQEFRDQLKRKKKIEITRARLKNHLRIHCVVNNFKALSFDSQTKERVTNTAAECKEAIGEYDAKQIVRKLMNDEDLINEITAYSKLQDDLAAKKDLAGLEKKKKIKSDKYFAAVGETKRIFVVEGDSASGGLIKCLGRKGNSFYALKGVPLNVLEVHHSKFMANKELSELYQIITTYPDAEICIATDADADGSRIRGLLILFMNQYFPDHYKDGKVRILKTPLAIGKKKNVVQEWAYTFAEVNGINNKLDVSYVKGLGSWSDKDLKLIIEKETIEKMLPSVKIDEVDLLYNWFSGKTSDFRKEQLIEAKPFDIQGI